MTQQKYKIMFMDRSERVQTAAYAEVGKGGTLGFYDANHQLIVAFSPSCWASYFPVREAKAL